MLLVLCFTSGQAKAAKSCRSLYADSKTKFHQLNVKPNANSSGNDDTAEFKSDLLKYATALQKKGLLQESEWLHRKAGATDVAERISRHLENILLNSPAAPRKTWQEISSQRLVYKVQLRAGIDVVFRPNDSEEPSGYIIDRLFGFDIVPIAVDRSFGKMWGSVQYFISNAREINEGDHIEAPPKIKLFNFLIGNIDGDERNFLLIENPLLKKYLPFTGFDFQSAWYNGSELLNNEQLVKMAQEMNEPELLKRLQSVPDSELHKKLDKRLGRGLVDGILKRRQKLLEALLAAGLLQ